jgi:transporter family-2 protein
MVLGIVAGTMVCLEGSLNALLGRHVGVLKATIAPFLVGLIGLLVVLAVVSRGEKWVDIRALAQAPWYSFLGGLAAVVFVSIMIAIIPKVGIAAALSAVIVGQFAMFLVLDALGLFALERIPISIPRLAGLALLVVGMRLMFLRPG